MEAKNLKAVLFDFGETLVTLSPAKEELFARAARNIGLELPATAIARAYQIVDFHHKYSSVTVTDREAFYRNYNELLCEALGISSHGDRLLPALGTMFKTEKHWQLIDGARDVLQQLHERGVRLAIVANWDTNLASLAARLEVAQFFSLILSSQEAGVEKPDPAIFQLALERLSLGMDPAAAMYVGNEYRADILGSRAAALTPVLIDRSGLYPAADCLRFSSLREWHESLR